LKYDNIVLYSPEFIMVHELEVPFSLSRNRPDTFVATRNSPLIKDLAAETMGQMILTAAEKITTAIEPILPAGFEKTFLSEIVKKHTKILIFSNHQSHADLLSVAKVSKLLTEMANKVLPEENKSPGYQLIIASSLAEGEQGALLQKCINQLTADFIPNYYLSTIEYMRPKDAAMYNARLRTEGKAMNRLQLKAFRDAKNVKFGFQLARGIKNNKGTIIFPSASVQEGRRKENGEIFGLTEIDSNSVKLNRTIKMAMKIHPLSEMPLILFMITHGGFNVLNPDTLSLTPEALAVARNSGPAKLIQVKLSLPKRFGVIANEIRNKGERVNSKTINEYVSRTFAELLPPEGQGFYRKA